MADKKEFAKSEESNECIFKKIKPDGNHSSWLDLITEYVEETQAHALDLGGKELGIQDVRYILNFLGDSQVTELNLERNRLTNGMASLSSLLTKTKIKTLNVSQCGLTKEDLLQLAEVLSESQITDLDVSNNKACFSFLEGMKYVSYLNRSKLTSLNLDLFKGLSRIEVAPFFQAILGSTITNLDLTGSWLYPNDYNFLFENLGKSSVTCLNLRKTKISSETMQELSRWLAETKIVKLDLGNNDLKDGDLNILAEGLMSSNVIDLDLTLNSFSNVCLLAVNRRIQKLNLRCNYGLKLQTFMYPNFLRSSALTSLDLRNCNLEDEAGEKLMECLRFTSVTKLDISWNALGFLTVNKFVENVQDLNFTDLDLSQNQIRVEPFLKLGRCLNQSKLTRIALNDMRNGLRELSINWFLSFLKQSEESPITRIELNSYFYFEKKIRLRLPEHNILAGTTFIELELAAKEIRDNASLLVNYLKYSSITYLNLAENAIRDNCAEALAEFLRKPDLRRLNLNKNFITSKGAKILAVEFKDSRIQYLHLNGNKINNDGLRFLAEQAKHTFITVLDVAQNPGDNVTQIEQVLWINKFVVPKLSSIFTQIAPKSVNDEFCFAYNIDGCDVSIFLEKCMWFYKTLVESPHAVDILLEATNAIFSKDQFFNMVSENFSLQFTQFIAFWVEADLEQHLSILELAERMAVTVIARDLLYNREVYLLDEGKNILHPYVYKLLQKYKMPICGHLDPEGGAKIIEHFTENSHIKGSGDVIKLLYDANNF